MYTLPHIIIELNFISVWNWCKSRSPSRAVETHHKMAGLGVSGDWYLPLPGSAYHHHTFTTAPPRTSSQTWSDIKSPPPLRGQNNWYTLLKTIPWKEEISSVNWLCSITEPVREKRAQSNSSEEPDSKVKLMIILLNHSNITIYRQRKSEKHIKWEIYVQVDLKNVVPSFSKNICMVYRSPIIF